MPLNRNWASWRSDPRLWLLAALVCSMIFRWILKVRDERAHRAEFDIVNESITPVSVKYRGYYGKAESLLAPREKWHCRFRASDHLTLEAGFHTRNIISQIPLWENVADLSTPGRPAYGEIQLWQVFTNQEGSVTMSTPITSSSSEPLEPRIELQVHWSLPRP